MPVYYRLLRIALAAALVIVLATVAAWTTYDEDATTLLATTTRSLQAIRPNHEDLEDKIVIFLDVDGVLAPYQLDPWDDDENDYLAVFGHADDDALAQLQDHMCWRNFTDDTLEALSHILENLDHSRTRVVLSSWWRVYPDCRKRVLEKFKEYGARQGGPLKHFHFFHDRTGKYRDGDRGQEIAKWLQRFNPDDDVLAAWVILDDREIRKGEINRPYRELFKGHVVQPDADAGLTMENAEEALELLDEQLGES